MKRMSSNGRPFACLGIIDLPTMARIKTLIVEDQVLFREFLVSVLQRKEDLLPIDTANNGRAALEKFRLLRPKVIILDILIPELSGIRVAQQIRRKDPDVRIVALSSERDLKTLYQIHQLRLQGFIDKNETSAETLSHALDQILQGKRYFSNSYLDAMQRLRSDPDGFYKILSSREQEFISLAGAGLSDAQLAEKLGIRISSVGSHRQKIFKKLNLHSSTELIRYAQAMGFYKQAFRELQIEDAYHLDE